MRLSSRRFLLALVVVATVSCAVGPEPQRPDPAALGLPSAYATPQETAPDAAPVDLAEWWRAFDDATLISLVERALEANTDLDAAQARVRQSRAALAGTRASWWPTLGASASASRRFGDDRGAGSVAIDSDRTTYDAGFDASYEVDVFGGVRRSVQASAADLAATEATLEATRTTIAAEVALNYFDARLAQRRLGIAAANLATQDETLQIVDWRMQAGLVGSLDLEQARRLRAQTSATVPSVEQDLAAAINRLAVLLAQPPADVRARLAAEAEIPLAGLPQVGIPADMIRRRPDVAQAEQALVAETARIGVRTADLYPALRLIGSFAGTGTSLQNATDAAVGNLVAGITAPLFEGGRLRAAVAQQQAAADAALADYRGVLLTAVEETENALVAVSATERRERDLVVAESAARNAAVLARSQYQAGLIDFQTLLDSERSLLTTEDGRATARASRAASLVQLYKALGGGWPCAPAATSTTTTP